MTIESMTGYGEKRVASEIGELRAELKSVNGRFCDIKVRLPHEMAALELPLLDRIKKRLGRGKIDGGVRLEKGAETQAQVEINTGLADAYRDALLALQDRWDVPRETPWREILSQPGVVSIQKPEFDLERMQPLLFEAIDGALDQLIAHRRREGEALHAAIAEELGKMSGWLEEIDRVRGEVVDACRERLEKALANVRERLPDAVSDGRLEAEVVLFADKADITEEIVRLGEHLRAFGQTLDDETEQQAGKRLEFLGQEMLREINTIGSKGRHTGVAVLVVELKHAAERIREQLANVR